MRTNSSPEIFQVCYTWIPWGFQRIQPESVFQATGNRQARLDSEPSHCFQKYHIFTVSENGERNDSLNKKTFMNTPYVSKCVEYQT